MNRNEPIKDGEYHHVYNRGNRRDRIFIDDSDYEFFLRRLEEYSSRYKGAIHVYCLMPNHYHLIMSQQEGGSIPSLMASLSTSVTKRFNLKYDMVGHLFQGPYKNKRISSDEYLSHLSRYIHLNPVSGGLTVLPQEWRYSNYKQFIGTFLAGDAGLADPAPILRLFKSSSEYAKFVRCGEEGRKSTFIMVNTPKKVDFQ
jgi:putative transposase